MSISTYWIALLIANYQYIKPFNYPKWIRIQFFLHVLIVEWFKQHGNFLRIGIKQSFLSPFHHLFFMLGMDGNSCCCQCISDGISYSWLTTCRMVHRRNVVTVMSNKYQTFCIKRSESNLTTSEEKKGGKQSKDQLFLIQRGWSRESQFLKQWRDFFLSIQSTFTMKGIMISLEYLVN